MAPFTYANIESLHDNYNRLFKKITSNLVYQHGINFRGAKKSGESKFDRYLKAFNKHAKSIRSTFGEALDEALSGKGNKKDEKVSLNYAAKALLHYKG